MADVSGRPARHTDRGQLILVAAVGIAALLVLLAVLLNAAVYTENLATRGGHTDHEREAVDYRVQSRGAVADLLERSNREGWPAGEFEAEVANWSHLSANHSATNGATTSVVVTGTTTGQRTDVVQRDPERDLTNRTGDTRWSVVTGASSTDISEWNLNVSRDSLVVVDPSTVTSPADLETAGAFTVEVNGTDDSTTITSRVFVYTDGTSVVFDDGAGTSCTVSPDYTGSVVVDFTAGTVDGTACAPLAPLVPDDSTKTYTITFDRSHNARGTYLLTVDQSLAEVNAQNDFYDSTDAAYTDDSPYATPSITDVTIDVTYARPGMRYHVDGIVIDAGESP